MTWDKAKMWRVLLVGFLLIIGVNIAAYISKYRSSNRDDARLKEVEHLFATIAIYPGSTEVRTSWSSKDRRARVGKVYKSDATYDDLKRYYEAELTQLGWRLEGERKVKDWWRDLGGRELRFVSGEHYVLIEYAGDKADYGWTYGISVDWRAS